jgi:hypothetical protein
MLKGVIIIFISYLQGDCKLIATLARDKIATVDSMLYVQGSENFGVDSILFG